MMVICDRLNNTPRKCLGWKTPAEVFREKILEEMRWHPYPEFNKGRNSGIAYSERASAKPEQWATAVELHPNRAIGTPPTIVWCGWH